MASSEKSKEYIYCEIHTETYSMMMPPVPFSFPSAHAPLPALPPLSTGKQLVGSSVEHDEAELLESGLFPCGDDDNDQTRLRREKNRWDGDSVSKIVEMLKGRMRQYLSVSVHMRMPGWQPRGAVRRKTS